MRLLDVGCGWGGMVLHAVKNYGVSAIGVTLSQQQAEWGQRAIEDAGLGGQAQIRFSDYRDVKETGFDAISSIGLTEHIGRANYPSYFSFLYGKLRTEGRLLNHCITRPDGKWPALYKRSFINRYVFPDGELTPPGPIITDMNEAGFEIRHEENLREHYALTLKHWCENLERNWDACVAEAGLPTARVWRLYMAASASTSTRSSCTRSSASRSVSAASPASRCEFRVRPGPSPPPKADTVRLPERPASRQEST
jgi:cyclopropane-fatty-acyl-phospholipid synthase